jgi:hypothetical protein
MERMREMPAGTLGFRISGELEDDDYTDVMMPALRQAIDAQQELRTLFLVDRLEEMEGDALWEDMKAGWELGVREHSAWKRTAFVTDQTWLARATRLFGWMMPGEFKLYPVAQLEDAKRWVAGQ